MQKTLKSFFDALRGLEAVLKEERNFKLEVLASVGVIVFASYFKFDPNEYIPLLIAIFMVLTAEIINTVIEDLCDKIEPNHNSVIKKVKDMMAAYVLVTGVGAIVIGFFVLYSHFYNLIMF